MKRTYSERADSPSLGGEIEWVRTRLAKARRQLHFPDEPAVYFGCDEHHHRGVPSLTELATGSVVKAILEDKITFERWMYRIMDVQLAVSLKCTAYEVGSFNRFSVQENGWIRRYNTLCSYFRYDPIRITRMIPCEHDFQLNVNYYKGFTEHKVFTNYIYNHLRKNIRNTRYDEHNVYFNIHEWKVSDVSDLCKKKNCGLPNRCLYLDECFPVGHVIDTDLSGISFNAYNMDSIH